MPGKKSSKVQNLRLTIQVVILVFVLLMSFNHSREEAGLPLMFGFTGAPSIHSTCPFGGLVTLYTYFTTGEFVRKLHPSNLVMLIGLLLLLVMTGASFCGWICPFGTVQELISKLGKALKIKKIKVPKYIDTPLLYLKYAVLLFVLFRTAKTGLLMFSNMDPYYALLNLWSDELSKLALIILGIVLLSSFFIERPWCRYACPLGAFQGLFNWLSIIKIKRKSDTCISCTLCNRNCPMGIDVMNNDAVNSPLCNRCLNCVDSCPKSKTLELKLSFPVNYK